MCNEKGRGDERKIRIYYAWELTTKAFISGS